MSNTQVVIMAAGQQSRWEGDGFKQLLQVGRETILGRIVRQCRNRNHEPTIMTHREELAICNTPVFVPFSRSWKVQSLIHWMTATRDADRYIVLLGDVVYTRDCMDKIISCESDIMFFGNDAEIFGMTFTSSSFQKVYKHCTLSLFQCVRNGDKGSLHTLFRSINGLDWTGNIENAKRTCPTFLVIKDATRDIDSMQDYVRFLQETSKGLDDQP